MPPPGYEPFLRAICADPADDTVRLAYADWLDENCDPARAEFIRLHIVIPARPRERDIRYLRVRELFAEYGGAWLAELPALEGVQWGNELRRGFCDRAIVRAAGDWVRHCAQVVSATPVQFLALSGAEQDGLRAALGVPEVGRITTLALWESRLARGHLRVVADSPYLAELRTLVLHRHAAPGMWANEAMTDDEAAALVNTPHLPKLETISLGYWVSRAAERLLRTRFKAVWGMNRTRPSPPGTPPA